MPFAVRVRVRVSVRVRVRVRVRLGLGLGLGFGPCASGNLPARSWAQLGVSILAAGGGMTTSTPGRKQTWHRPEGWVSAMPG